MKPSYTAIIVAFMFAFVSYSANAQVAYPRFQKHTVQDGESASSIASLFNVTVADFCLLNDFPKDVKLKPGQIVLVKQLKEGEKEVMEEGTYKKSKSSSSEPFATPSEDKPKPGATKTTATTTEEKSKSTTSTKTTSTTSSESPKPAATTPSAKETPKSEPANTVEKLKPASTPVAEKPKPASAPVSEKKTASSEPFVVPPPSTKAVELGPHGEVYNVSKTGYHVVAKGQTFFRIALIYGLSVDELKDLNGMSNYNISVGQKLKVRK